jgi:hypothetical protein
MFSRAKDQVSKAVRQRYGGANGISKMAGDVSLLMGIINTEDKHVDVLSTVTTCIATTPVVQTLGTMAQGNTNITRIGNSILINKIDLQLTFIYSCGTAATTANQNQIFRWFLVRWAKTPSSSGTVAFTITDFLNVDAGGNVSATSMANTDLNENFVVMETGTVEIVLPSTTAANSNVSKVVTVSHPCHFHQTYTGANNTTLVDNAYQFVCVALNPANAGGSSQVSCQSRTWFIDN